MTTSTDPTRVDARNIPGPGVPTWMFGEFPVISGKGKDAVILTYDQIENEGYQIQNLREGCWFAMITANEQGNGFVVATGWVEHQGVGGTCIRLNRSWDNAYWVAPESKVIVIPNPFPDREDEDEE